MDKRIVFKNKDGSVGVIIPAKGCGLTVKQIAEKDVPEGLEWRILDEDKLPTDRYFREAWTDDNPTETVDVDVEKAKNIKMLEVRFMRNEKLKELDVETMRGLDVQKDKQVLRDLPENIELPDDLEELKSFVPEELK